MMVKSDQPHRIGNAPVDRILLGDLRQLVEESRSSVATTVYAALTRLYWQIGKRINEETLKGERARFSDETFGCTQKLGSLLPVWILP